MSETPRTDLNEYEEEWSDEHQAGASFSDPDRRMVVTSAFARKLETELAAANAKIGRLECAIKAADNVASTYIDKKVPLLHDKVTLMGIQIDDGDRLLAEMVDEFADHLPQVYSVPLGKSRIHLRRRMEDE